MHPPSTIKDLLSTTSATLAPLSDAPRLEAEILMAHVLGKPRTYLHAWPEKPLEPAQHAHYRELVARRQAGEPIAYIIGMREFWSREFWVTPAVLIPRPDTELLVELALARIPPAAPCRIADLGTGSGSIAITIALERPRASVSACDISAAALDVARANAGRLGAANVEFILSDWLDGLAPRRFAMILSNPPYIEANDPHLAEGDLRFEPQSALASGGDGLAAIRRIVAEAGRRLEPGGALLLEHGYQQAASVRKLLCESGYVAVSSHRDLAGHERVTLGSMPT